MKNLDYGIIGNCRTAALVSKEGNIEWLCFPDFDSPSIFAAILDKEKGGSFGFKVAKEYSISQRYVSETNILTTTFDNGKDGFELLDFMPRYKTGGDASDYYIPAEIYRSLKVIKGNPKIKINYSPSLNYARERTDHLNLGTYIRS